MTIYSRSSFDVFLVDFNLVAWYLPNKKSCFYVLNHKKPIALRYYRIIIQLIVLSNLEEVDKICKLLIKNFST